MGSPALPMSPGGRACALANPITSAFLSIRKPALTAPGLALRIRGFLGLRKRSPDKNSKRERNGNQS
jgi:hypothetical protein